MGVLLFQIGQKRSNFNLSLKIAQMLKYQRSEFFVKCSTVHRLLNQYVKMAYGQNVQFLRFARKWQSSVTYNGLFGDVWIHGNKNRLFGLFPS
ncbi:hypothetical protein HMPREF0542_11535 [Ligilactobacillus ruminis ATCC 25644]|uniref:Uncharacterized protein n=1 Tax=Ligilactobacillus ruminis ATCC 25644 TaxID=525362 RepID=E7FRK8_9LACO|nr:hypothetical protein HMPREF0542_11535 [Ligilactobacillus ruminis ATCC 25644]